jgi:hypothetical protein
VKKTDAITLEIADASGRIIRTFNSGKDSTFSRWDGGPPPEPTLPMAKGINRFVWDMRHATMGGVPGVYIEASYRGHKVSPGRYRLTLTLGDRTATTDAEVLAHPLYAADAATYSEYDTFMSRAEGEVTRMHDAANDLYEAQEQLAGILAKLPATPTYAEIRRDGEALLAKLKAWDGDMVSRKSKAYDDVENFAQKFAANWLFMINATESDLPLVNQPSKDRLTELEPELAKLKARADTLGDDIQTLNRKLFDLGVGAIKKKPAGPRKIG